MKTRTFLLFCLLFWSYFAAADEIYLKNGDRLTGHVSKMDAGKLVVKTTFAGDVEIDWDTVSTVLSDTLLVVKEQGKDPVRVREVSRVDSKLLMETPDGRRTTNADNLVAIRSEHQFDIYQRTLHPALRDNWLVTVSTGMSLARGNSSATNVNLGLDAARKTLRDKMWFSATSLYATDDRLDRQTANANRGAVRYDHDVNPNLFVYGSAAFEADALQALDLRSIAGGGFGHHVVQSPKHTLDVRGGLAYTRELYNSAPTRNLTAGSIGQDYLWSLSPNTHVDQKLTFDTYLNDIGNYRTAFDVTFSTRFMRLLSWQTKVSERYVSNPLPGFRNNDVILTTGLGLTFASPIE